MKKSYIYGIHAISAALQNSPSSIEQLFVLDNLSNKRIQLLLENAKKSSINIKIISKTEADHLVGEVSHQGIIALYMAKAVQESDLWNLLDAIEKDPFILILDGIQDPHNLGACMRTANAAGVHIIIAPKDNSVGLTPVVRKVASGAAEITPYIQVTNLARTLRELKKRGVWIYGLSERGEKSIFESDLKGSKALVMGAEGVGMRRLTEEHCDALLSIPMIGTVESLNVSVATGICLYECLRQSVVIPAKAGIQS